MELSCFRKKLISYFMNIMYKHIFLNFGVISFINKEMVSLFQLHTYKFGLVYIHFLQAVCVLREHPKTFHENERDPFQGTQLF